MKFNEHNNEHDMTNMCWISYSAVCVELYTALSNESYGGMVVW